MRRAGQAVVVWALAALVACSSDKQSRDREPSGSGGGTGTMTGSSTGSGGLGPIGVTDGGGTGGADSGGTIPDPVADPCKTTADCSDGGAGYVCTIAGRCGKISGDCTDQAQCMSDTYCCKGATCRQDGLDQGVCIPGFVPPGPECKGSAKIGVFSPAVQCEWPGKSAPAEFDKHVQVMSTPMVADTPVDSGTSAEIVFVAGNQTVGEVTGKNPAYFGVLRIVSGQTCELKVTIADPQNPLRQTAPPALGDLDKDGNIDIVARRNDQGLVAFRWDAGQKNYVT